MLTLKNGNMLNSDVEALVNTVNCVGVMGRGVALQFKEAYPDNYQAYVKACKLEQVLPGKMFTFKTDTLVNPKYIINFPTKRHWKGKSRIEDIESGLIALHEVITQLGIQSIAIPPLGSGLGGLYWPDVRRLIEARLSDLEGVDIRIFEPKLSSDEPVRFKASHPPKMTISRAILIASLERYRRVIFDPDVTLLELHKLLYLIQGEGERLKLRYEKGPYGPYSDNLRHVLTDIEGYFVIGYADGGDSPTKPISVLPGAAVDAHTRLLEQQASLTRIDRVMQLIDGWESPHGLELLSTVHWVVTQEAANQLVDVVRHVFDWNDRKRKLFTERQIGLAYNRLLSSGWIAASQNHSAL